MITRKIIKGDCLEIMQQLIEEGIKVDMVLTDPPYAKTKNSWDTVIPFDKMWTLINSINKNNGAVLLFGQGSFSSKLMLSNEKHHKCNLVWDKVLPGGFLNANRMILPVHEDILVFYSKQPTFNPQKTIGKPNNSRGKPSENLKNNNYGNFSQKENSDFSGMKFPKSILQFAKPHPSVSVHPTQKPIELLEYLIKTYTNEGDTVLDFTMGSGSTGVACVNTGRKFIGIELDDKYFEIAKERIEKAEIEKIGRVIND